VATEVETELMWLTAKKYCWPLEARRVRKDSFLKFVRERGSASTSNLAQ
jgi:hypothetical protein